MIKFNIDQRGIATITLDRIEVHNAFDDTLIRELQNLLERINKDNSIRVVILAAIGKSFSAGADLNWMQRMVNYTYEENLQDAAMLSQLMQTLKFLEKPTIARVQGAAYGGGVGLVACCDIAVASTDAIFCLSEVKIGLAPVVISPYVIQAIGERAAHRYFLTAEPITAEKAHQLGLIAELAAPEALNQVVEGIVTALLQNSPEAIIVAKEVINRGVTLDPHMIEQNLKTIANLRISAEGQEGMTAFLRKRKPKWTDK